ncbi:unnamed protein product [Gordionus sp. m RMFG-2023]
MASLENFIRRKTKLSNNYQVFCKNKAQNDKVGLKYKSEKYPTIAIAAKINSALHINNESYVFSPLLIFQMISTILAGLRDDSQCKKTIEQILNNEIPQSDTIANGSQRVTEKNEDVHNNWKLPDIIENILFPNLIRNEIERENKKNSKFVDFINWLINLFKPYKPLKTQNAIYVKEGYKITRKFAKDLSKRNKKQLLLDAPDWGKLHSEDKNIVISSITCLKFNEKWTHPFNPNSTITPPTAAPNTTTFTLSTETSTLLTTMETPLLSTTMETTILTATMETPILTTTIETPTLTNTMEIFSEFEPNTTILEKFATIGSYSTIYENPINDSSNSIIIPWENYRRKFKHSLKKAPTGLRSKLFRSVLDINEETNSSKLSGIFDNNIGHGSVGSWTNEELRADILKLSLGQGRHRDYSLYIMVPIIDDSGNGKDSDLNVITEKLSDNPKLLLDIMSQKGRPTKHSRHHHEDIQVEMIKLVDEYEMDIATTFKSMGLECIEQQGTLDNMVENGNISLESSIHNSSINIQENNLGIESTLITNFGFESPNGTDQVPIDDNNNNTSGNYEINSKKARFNAYSNFLYFMVHDSSKQILLFGKY